MPLWEVWEILLGGGELGTAENTHSSHRTQLL